MNTVTDLENVENYQMLATAIIEQACKDYAANVKYRMVHGKKPGISDGRWFTKFVKSQWFDLLSNHMDGMALKKKIENNVKKYGKGLLTEHDWDLVAKGEVHKISKAIRVD